MAKQTSFVASSNQWGNDDCEQKYKKYSSKKTNLLKYNFI